MGNTADIDVHIGAKTRSTASFAHTMYPDEASRDHRNGKSQNKPLRYRTGSSDLPLSVSGPMATNQDEENENDLTFSSVPHDVVPEPAAPESSAGNLEELVTSEHDDTDSSEPVCGVPRSPEIAHDISVTSESVPRAVEPPELVLSGPVPLETLCGVPQTPEIVCGASEPSDPAASQPASIEPNFRSSVPFESARHASVSSELVPVRTVTSEPGHGAPVSYETVRYIPVPIAVTNNYYIETSALLPPSSAQKWKVSYEKCLKVAMQLDLYDGWKLLASKLHFDEVIDWVDQWAKNKNTSPTVLLLQKWMIKQNTENDETCFNSLLNAFRAMSRNDIADDLEDLDD